MLNYIALLKIVKKHVKWSKNSNIHNLVLHSINDQYLFKGDGEIPRADSLSWLHYHCGVCFHGCGRKLLTDLLFGRHI